MDYIIKYKCILDLNNENNLLSNCSAFSHQRQNKVFNISLLNLVDKKSTTVLHGTSDQNNTN